MDIVAIFMTGLFAGGLTCLAAQGGLLATSLAQQQGDRLQTEADDTGKWLPVAAFLLTRLLAYTTLGFFLGALGSVFQLSLNLKIFFQLAVSIFMLGTAMNLLQAHPIFRYFIVQPPRFLARMIRNQSKRRSVFGPAILGAMTVLIPCGATQAMMAYAVTTGSPALGGLTMFTFIVGTSPLFFILGILARRLGTALSGGFNRVAAAALIIISLYNINGAIALTGTSYTLENILYQVRCAVSFCEQPVTGGQSAVVARATVFFTRSGYRLDPGRVSVAAGSRVKLKLVNESGSGCIQAFTIPKLNLQRTLAVGATDEIDFVAPSTPGPLAFMCTMGMYRGSIEVVKS